MRPMNRRPVNKYKSAGKFRKHAGKMKAANLTLSPMRGGYRL